MQNTPQTRRVTRGRIGPWYVMQSRNPAAPGMKLDVLLGFIRKGQVTARSIVRGPTTHQFWRYAAHVKGLSREFGLCFSCGADIATESNLCPHCGKLQEPPIQPDVLLEGQPAHAGRPLNGHVTAATVSAYPTDTPSGPIPDMVDAEVVISRPKSKSSNGSTAHVEPTRVVIEPMVEPEPPLAEPEIEPAQPRSSGYPDSNGNGHGYGNGRGDSNGNGNGNGHHYGDGTGHTVPEPTIATTATIVEDEFAQVSEALRDPVSMEAPEAPTGPSEDAGSALMSPADLAAAFHLKFTPIAEFNHQDSSTATKLSGATLVKIILAILIVLLVVAAILLPDQRAAVIGWLHSTLWQPNATWFAETP